MKRTIPVVCAGLVLMLASAVGFGVQAQKPEAPDPNRAPELVGGPWINTKDGEPVSIKSRRGKPTLVAFWTFACENCQHNIPAYARLLAKYRSKGVELIAIHTPEMKVEHDLEQVKAHVTRFKIDYPVLIDNGNANWSHWGVGVWPSLYVVDGDGIVRYHWFGELNWKGAGGEVKIAQVLDDLLAEQSGK
jgi:thiol-disulfide isomerase/thioredoxin